MIGNVSGNSKILQFNYITEKHQLDDAPSIIANCHIPNLMYFGENLHLFTCAKHYCFDLKSRLFNEQSASGSIGLSATIVSI